MICKCQNCGNEYGWVNAIADDPPVCPTCGNMYYVRLDDDFVTEKAKPNPFYDVVKDDWRHHD